MQSGYHRLCQKLNADGSVRKNCQNCIDSARNRRGRLKEYYKKLKTDRIKQHGVSCVECQYLLFKPNSEESLVAQRIQTYLKEDGKRYCVIVDKEYSVEHVLETAEHLLELSIIDFDHLTMQEQIARGIISEESEYKPKIAPVSRMTRKRTMRAEARKCQHLCSYCHVKVTSYRARQARGDVDAIKRMSALSLKKYEYLDSLRSCGCSSCGFKDMTFPRFLEMDHLHSKIDCVTFMATDMNVTFEQFVAECAKCRVLCQFCHRIWTRKQVAALVKARLELEVSNNQSLKTIDDSIDRLEAEITRSENEDNE